MFACVETHSSLIDQIMSHQFKDKSLCHIRDKWLQGRLRKPSFILGCIKDQG